MKVVVVGAGVVGLCSAYFLRQRGHEIEIWEQFGPEDRACSYGNGGMIVPSHFVPLAAPGMVSTGLKMMLNPKGPFRIKPRLSLDLVRWMTLFAQSANERNVARSEKLLVDLNLASRNLYEEFDRQAEGAFGLRSSGLLMLCKKQQTLDHEAILARRANALGLDSAVLNPTSLTAADPGIEMNVAGAVHYREDRHFSPPAFLQWMRGELESLGVQIRFQTALVSLSESREGVHLGSGDLSDSADAVVLACGAWTGELGKLLGMRIPMQAGKGYSFMVASPPQMPSICALLAEARVAVTPMDGQLRLGGTMEIAGLDRSISRKRVQAICDATPEYYPAFRGFDYDRQSVWSGLRPCTPDGLPYVGKPKKWHRAIIAAGHAMMGMSMGPITGELVADIVEGKSPRFDLGLLDPNRFA